VSNHGECDIPGPGAAIDSRPRLEDAVQDIEGYLGDAGIFWDVLPEYREGLRVKLEFWFRAAWKAGTDEVLKRVREMTRQQPNPYDPHFH